MEIIDGYKCNKIMFNQFLRTNLFVIPTQNIKNFPVFLTVSGSIVSELHWHFTAFCFYNNLWNLFLASDYCTTTFSFKRSFPWTFFHPMNVFLINSDDCIILAWCVINPFSVILFMLNNNCSVKQLQLISGTFALLMNKNREYC